MNLETKITIYKFTPQLFTLTPLPAKERYEEFKQQFPQICQRVKLRYIASYLGITLPTLSRLRAKK